MMEETNKVINNDNQKSDDETLNKYPFISNRFQETK